MLYKHTRTQTHAGRLTTWITSCLLLWMLPSLQAKLLQTVSTHRKMLNIRARHGFDVYWGLIHIPYEPPCKSLRLSWTGPSSCLCVSNLKSITHIEVDLVTETDKACEKLVFEHIGKSFPDHKFIGEETTALSGSFDLTDAPTWIIDPLDGTTNFVHRFPFVCVSIGLTIEKVPVVGVVYNPILNELFTAVKGGGAFLNGKPIRASSQENLGSALLATEVGTKRDKVTVDATTDRINSLLYKVRSLRMTGSCALNLCGIACGRLDCFYELGYGGPWDVAAGVIIVQEAGGMIFSPSGEAFDIGTQRIAASNGYLKDSFVAALKETDVL